MQIFFTVPGVPVAKGRPRGRIITSKHTGKQFVGMYTPKATDHFENKVAVFFRTQYQGTPPIEPVSIIIRTYFPIPESWSKKKKLEYQTNTMPKISKPDIDNVVKGILDGLNGIAFKDDNQIWSLSATKQYSINPRTEVTIITS